MSASPGSVTATEIVSSDIERNGLPWAMVDEFDLRSGHPVVVNTDRKGGPGVHWIVLTPLESGVHLYDPLGPRNERVDSQGRAVDGIVARRAGDRVYIYPHTSQLSRSTLCGWFAIYVARLITTLVSRHPKVTPRDLDSLIESQFGLRADAKDVDVLRRAFTKK